MITALAAIFILLQLGDFVTTRQVLSRGGRELNPIVQWLMTRLGIIPGLAVAKILAVALIVYLTATTQIDQTVLIILNLIYLAVVINNYRVAQKLGQP